MRVFQGLIQILESNAFFFQAAVDHGAGAAGPPGRIHGQTQNRAGVQFEFALPLADHGDHASVVGAGTDFAEPNPVSTNKQFDPEQPATAQIGGYGFGNLLGFFQRGGRHGLRLPGFHIVAVLLNMADGIAEVRVHLAGFRIDGPHREQGDFVVEVDLLLHDHPAPVHPRPGLSVTPGPFHILRTAHGGLALAGGRHHRLDDARITDAAVDGHVQLVEGFGEGVAGRGQFQFLGGQTADAFAVHGQLGGAGGGDDPGQAVRLDGGQRVSGDGLNLRYDEMWSLFFHQSTQGRGVGHVDAAPVVSRLMTRGVGIPVHGDDLHPQPLQGNHNFFAQFPGAQQHDPNGGGRKGSSDAHRFWPLVCCLDCPACQKTPAGPGPRIRPGVRIVAERKFFHGTELP